MFNHRDQADGLRRMMTKPHARIISILSTDDVPAQGWLLNLATSMLTPEQRLLLIQADGQGWPEAAQTPALEDIAMRKTTLNRAIARHETGVDRARFTESNGLRQPLSANLKTAFNGIVDQLAQDYEIVMIEAQHDTEHGLPLPLMPKHELVVQLHRSEHGIKAAYSCIKRVCQQYGNRPFGIVVTAANEAQGQQYFLRLNQVCQQFLGVALNFLGAIPEDEALQQSTALGRSVIDAFPKAKATLAFKAIANSLGKQRLLTPSLVAA